MPAFQSSTPSVSLQPGLPVTLINAKDPAAPGFYGQPVAIAGRGGNSGHRIRFSGAFVDIATGLVPTAPGAFEVDIYDSTFLSLTDAQLSASATVVTTPGQTFAIELDDSFTGQFLIPFVKSFANFATVALILTALEQG